VCETGSIGQKQQVVVEEFKTKNPNVSTYDPPTTANYEICIRASQMSGDIVSDGCGYTYSFKFDYPKLRVWRCTFRGFCNSILQQIKKPGVDFLRTYDQEDFTLNAPQAHNHPPVSADDSIVYQEPHISHPPNNEIGQRQLPYVQLCSTTNGPSFNLENISACLPARASAVASINYQDTHLTNPEVHNDNRDRCRDQRQANKNSP
jgi:hypothetical protein